MAEEEKVRRLSILRDAALRAITKRFPPRFGEREARQLNPTVAELSTFMAEFADAMYTQGREDGIEEAAETAGAIWNNNQCIEESCAEIPTKISSLSRKSEVQHE